MNQLLAAELEGMWRETAVPTRADELNVCGTSVSLNGADVAVAYDAKARRHLLIPFGREERVGVGSDWGALEFKAPRELIHDGRKRKFLDVVCKDSALDGVFARLGAELVTQAAQQPDDAAAKCVATLEDWRELFVTASSPFGPEKALGLLGELWMLRELVKRDVRAIAYWLGPTGAVHDLRNAAKVIEVKSTLRRNGRIVTINGMEQLLAPVGGSLVLVVLNFIAVPNGSLSLRSLIDDLLKLGIAHHQLESLLKGEKFVEGANPELEQATFEVRETTAYSVTDGFPRIVPSSFSGGANPDRVVRLEYQLDLTGQPPIPLTAVEMSTAITEFLKP